MGKRKSDDTSNRLPRSEIEAMSYVRALTQYVEKEGGQYLKADDGSLSLILENTRISISFDRDNYELAKLMLKVCRVSSLSSGAQAAIQRLQVIAHSKASSLSVKKFAAMSEDRSRLYIPVRGAGLLNVTAVSIETVPNGDNEDRLWVEHPHVTGGAPAFTYRPQEVRDGLNKFERLLVATQSCRAPAMSWLVAMHEALFPFVRDVCKARFILVHIGGTQQGKTSGAERFTLLLGLGEVTGDFTVAALANQGDTGLLVLDNKEQANFNQNLIDFCLFLSTGAQRGRSTTEGKQRPQPTTRPVGVITSIEGAYKPELQARCVEVSYAINNTCFDRDSIEDEILESRDSILSAMVSVFQCWLKLRGTKSFWTSCPRPSFERHFKTLAELLMAYGLCAGKPDGWAEGIVAAWISELSQPAPDSENEDDLEAPIIKLLTECLIGGEKIRLKGKPGTLYVTDCGTLLTNLKQNFRGVVEIPKNATGLGRRLRSGRFSDLTILDHESAPELEQLKRSGQRRPIGFFLAATESPVAMTD